MLVEKHSKQKTPGPFYDDVLAEPYSNIHFDDPEYREVVQKLCDLLKSTSIDSEAMQAVLFAIGGTDDRTLAVTVPALVQFLAESLGQPVFEEGHKCLARMLSSPDDVRRFAAQIRQALPQFAQILQLVKQRRGEESDATATLLELQSLLA
jgi:hypothetical protein